MLFVNCFAVLCLASAVSIDGDTIRSGDLRIRIWGINAPEMREPGGRASKAAMAALISGQALGCDPVDIDRYGRTVAVCRLPDGRDVACEQVHAGQAADWPAYSRGAYARCEE